MHHNKFYITITFIELVIAKKNRYMFRFTACWDIWRIQIHIVFTMVPFSNRKKNKIRANAKHQSYSFSIKYYSNYIPSSRAFYYTIKKKKNFYTWQWKEPSNMFLNFFFFLQIFWLFHFYFKNKNNTSQKNARGKQKMK